MTKAKAKPDSLRSLSTGISGLDTIWAGGPRQGGVYLFHGRPGAGKTILSNQICFNHVANGGKALFVTLLTESHARLLSHMRELEFFDERHLGSSLQYLSGYEVLEKQNLNGLLTLLRKAIREQKTTLLVLDGLVTVGTVAESELALKKFVHELQTTIEMLGCTALVLTGTQNDSEQYAIRTMVDGLIELKFEPWGMSVARTIEVVKSRGSGALMGLDWATLHRRTFGTDVLACPCGGRRTIRALHSTRKQAEQRLADLGITVPPWRLPPATAPPQLNLAV